jgi:hypothetical protein
MRTRFLITLAFFLVMTVNASHGAEIKDFAGTWAMPIDQHSLYVLTLVVEGNDIKGSLDRPAKVSSMSNAIFANIGGGIQHIPIIRGQFAKDTMHITLPVNDDPKDEDQYVMLVHGNQAELVPDDPFVGNSLALERVPPGTRPSADWEPNRAYSINDSSASSNEMKAIADEDQKVRTAAKIDWNAVNESDAVRREQTRKLLADGALHTGEDYENASLIFQHSHSPEDYLLAHTLALVAVSKGDATAVWLAAATLDRYLEAIGQKQIYGTQFSVGADHKVTQEPYSRDLVSDALRRQLGVPAQATQTQRAKTLQQTQQ